MEVPDRDSRSELPLRIGLTGGIASGKSTVTDIFARFGAAIIDTDVVAREVVAPGQPALDDIRAVFSLTTLNCIEPPCLT